MTHEPLVQDRVDRLDVVATPFCQSPDLRPLARGSHGSLTTGVRHPSHLLNVRRPVEPGKFVTVHIVNTSIQYAISGTTADEISASVESAVRSGRLRPGEKLPTVRSLAAELAVSPTTVAASYRELTRRGIVLGEGRRGTRVRPAPPISGRLPLAVPPGVLDLRTGGPDPLLLPTLPGRADTVRASRPYGESPVSSSLARVATDKLAADGVDASRIAVVGGALDGVERVLGAWLRPGDRVAVEDPGYTAVLDLAAAIGLRLVPVGMDDRGTIPGELESALDHGASAAVLTPRAQNPTGAAWDASRAAELRKVLRRHSDVLVVEDDHAGPAAGISTPHDLRRYAEVGDDPLSFEVARAGPETGRARRRPRNSEQGGRAPSTRPGLGELPAAGHRRRHVGEHPDRPDAREGGVGIRT